MVTDLRKYLGFFIICIISAFFTMCELVHQDEPREPVRFDAITSASEHMGTNRIQIDSGFVYDTFAILYTYYSDSHDEHFLAWGPDSTKMMDTLPIPLWPRSAVCTLSNLKPYTNYSIVFRGQFSKDPVKENHAAWGSFTTTKLSSHF